MYKDKTQLFPIEFVNATKRLNDASKVPFVILDVRSDEEIAFADLPDKTESGIPLKKINIPIADLVQDDKTLEQLPKDKYILCLCHVGIRSNRAAFHLKNKGYHALNLMGGIDELSRYFPDIPQY